MSTRERTRGTGQSPQSPKSRKRTTHADGGPEPIPWIPGGTAHTQLEEAAADVAVQLRPCLETLSVDPSEVATLVASGRFDCVPAPICDGDVTTIAAWQSGSMTDERTLWMNALRTIGPSDSGWECAFFINGAWVRREVESAWSDLPKTYDIASPAGEMRLSGISVRFGQDNLIETAVSGKLDIAGLDIAFTLRIKDTLFTEGGAIRVRREQDVTSPQGWADFVLDLFGFDGPTDIQGAGALLADALSALPDTVMLPLGQEVAVDYSTVGVESSTRGAVFARGSWRLAERTPDVEIHGPNGFSLIDTPAPGTPTVTGHYTIKVDDLRGALTTTWKVDRGKVVEASPTAATIRFELEGPPTPGRRETRSVEVRVVDEDGLEATDKLRATIRVEGSQGGDGQGGSGQTHPRRAMRSSRR